MKKTSILLVAMLMLVVFTTTAQDKSKRPSPPAVAEGKIDGVSVKIEYSQPSVKGRKIFGGLEPYGEVWRTGANEATKITFDKPVKIEGKELAAGSYSLWSIPGEDEWTIIINSQWEGVWGTHYNRVKDSDLLQVKVKPAKTEFTEKFQFNVNKDNVTFMWENTAVAFKVKG